MFWTHVFWGFVIFIIVRRIMRKRRTRQRPRTLPADHFLKLVQEHYVRGEITLVDMEQRVERLLRSQDSGNTG